MPIYADNGFIIELFPHEIIVVGTNSEGAHHGGAAAQAHRHFGLEWGVCRGISGQTYAFPTMDGLKKLKQEARILYITANQNAENEFHVTLLGCGIAGHKPEDVAPFFADAPKNVILPKEFTEILNRRAA